MCEKCHIWNPTTCSCENDRCAGSIVDDSVTMCNEITETAKGVLTKAVPTKSIPTNFKEKKLVCKMKNFYILPTFLSMTMILLIAFSINCFNIKYQAKQKHGT